MHTATSTKATRSLAVSLVALAATAAGAQTGGNAQGLLDNKWVFSGGVFLVGTDVNASLNGTSTRNPEVDFDQAFGDDSDSTRGRIDALWRITPKHHMRFMYFNNNVSRSKTLDRDIQWGDATYKVGANVQSETKMTVYELAYEYAFMRAPSYEIAGTFGVHYTDLSLRLSGNATVNGVPGTFESRSSSLPAPLPVLGYDGNWWDLRAGATWMFARNFGVGLGYSRFTARVDVDRPSFNGHLKTGYSGLQAFLTGTF
jgi:hypothetical protein